MAPKEKREGRRRKKAGSGWGRFLLLLFLLAAAGGGYLWLQEEGRFSDRFRETIPPEMPLITEKGEEKPPADGTAENLLPRPVIDFGEIGIDSPTDALTADRKARFGVEESLDMIVRGDEAIRLGETTIPMAEILDKIRIQRKAIGEEDLQRPGFGAGVEKEVVARKIEAAKEQYQKIADRFEAPKTAGEGTEEELPPSSGPVPEQFFALEMGLARAEDLKKTKERIKKGRELLEASDLHDALEADIEGLEAEKSAVTARLEKRPPPAPSLSEEEALSARIAEGRSLAKKLGSELKDPERVLQQEEIRELQQIHAALEPLMEEERKRRAIIDRLHEKREGLSNFGDLSRAKEMLDEIAGLKYEKEQSEDRLKRLLAQVAPLLPPSHAPDGPWITDDRYYASSDSSDDPFLKRLSQAVDEYEAVTSKLSDPDTPKALKDYREKAQGYIALQKSLDDLTAAAEIEAEIEKRQGWMEWPEEEIRSALQKEMDGLSLQQRDLEYDLREIFTADESPEIYGIHVVRSGDNIWDIHFDFLREYLYHREIHLSPAADEPILGRSTGVGKILKFSENMVFIYNVREKRLVRDINLIHPRSKIVVFNMREALSMLSQIDYENIDRIYFDGETLWIPGAEG